MRDFRYARVGAAVAMTVVGAVSMAHAGVEDDVEAAVQSWADAYNSHEPAHVAEQYASDAVFWGTTSPTLRDSAREISEYFESLTRRPNARVTIGEHLVRVVGDVALVTGSYTFTDRVDDATIVRPSRFSFAFRLANGRWRLVQHHSSRMPE